MHVLGPLEALLDGLREELAGARTEGIGQCICISLIQNKTSATLL